MGDYTFGDTDLAGERLRILDTVFAATSRSVMSGVSTDASAVAPGAIGGTARDAAYVDVA